MTEVQELFLNILSAALAGRQAEEVFTGRDFWQTEAGKQGVSWQELQKIAEEQGMTGFFNDYMLTWEREKIPKPLQGELQKQAFSAAIKYYRLADFAAMVLELVKKQKFHACILKGVGLSAYYPKEELRKAGDVDLYLPVSGEFDAFCALLKKSGFEQEKSITDHHVSFFYVSDGIRFELEVHKKPINSQENKAFNQGVAEIFAPFHEAGNCCFPEVETILGSVPVLPPEQNACYLLLHMLQHFLSGGMGIRMLCDWVVFWKHAGQETGFSVDRYLSFIKKCRIEGFHFMITGLCISCLELSLQEVPWMEGNMPEKKAMEAFLKDIFDGGEFGGKDSSRMLITAGPAGYLKEFHRQMHLRFQKAGKVPVLWPFLWAATGMVFLYNNMFLRKTSARQVLQSASERGRLLQEIQLFKK